MVDKAARYQVSDSLSMHGLIAINAEFTSGMSGGVVVDKYGHVVGIVVDVGSTNSVYAVPIDYARRVADEIIDYQEPRHPWLAIRGQDLDLETARTENVDGGVRVTDVLSGGPADNAGLQVGDVIVSVDDTSVWAMSDLVVALRDHKPSHTVSLTYVPVSYTHLTLPTTPYV